MSDAEGAVGREPSPAGLLANPRLGLSTLSGLSEDDIPRDRVGFGWGVTVRDLDTKRAETYALTLGEFIDGNEDGAGELPVSMASPLGKALVGGKVGHSVTIDLPLGRRRLKITQLVTVHDLAERRAGTDRGGRRRAK